MDSMQSDIFILVMIILISILLYWIHLDHSNKARVSSNSGGNSIVSPPQNNQMSFVPGLDRVSETSKTPLSWSAKPFMEKTLVKFGIIFFAITLPLINTPLVGLWVILAIAFFGFYYLSKNSFTYHITDRSVKIEKSWVLGNYIRELTFDQILDIHINQGILARMFNCGSLVFLTKTGLEVGAIVAGGGVAGSGRRVGGFGGAGTATPTVVKGRGNTFWDIPEPEEARELLMKQLTEWRTVYQQQSMAVSLGVIAGKAQPVVSISTADELTKLKNLYDNNTITKEEYEKAKLKLLS